MRPAVYRHAIGYLLRASWPWILIWLGVLLSNVSRMQPEFARPFHRLGFYELNGLCGWFLAASVAMGLSSSKESFWRSRPLEPWLVLVAKLSLLVPLMVVLPLYLEHRLVADIPIFGKDFLVHGVATLSAGLLVPLTLATLFPSWGRFLAAAVIGGLGVQLFGVLVGQTGLGEYFRITPASTWGVCVAMLSTLGIALRWPGDRRLPAIAVGLLWIVLPVSVGLAGRLGPEIDQDSGYPSAVLDVQSGSERLDLSIEPPSNPTPLPRGTHYELYADLSLDHLESQSEYRIRWLETRFSIPGGPSWQLQPEVPFELFDTLGSSSTWGVPALGVDSRELEAPIMILSRETAAPYADQPGALDLTVEVVSRQPIKQATLALKSDQTVFWRDRKLRMVNFEIQEQAVWARVESTALVQPRVGFVGLEAPALRIPGWITRSQYRRLFGEEPRSPKLGRQSRVEDGYHMIRDLATLFPPTETLVSRVHVPHEWVPDPRLAGPPPVPTEVEILGMRESTVLRRTLRLEQVTLSDLDLSGQSRTLADATRIAFGAQLGGGR